MKRLFAFGLFGFSLMFFGCLVFTCCGSKDESLTSAQVAANSAKVYYDQLLQGDYGSFVDGRYQPNRLPQGYREQLIANAKMFVAQQEKEHKGIKSVAVTDAKADTAGHVVNAFLTFAYGDGTKEEVLVPMVESKGVWYMR